MHAHVLLTLSQWESAHRVPPRALLHRLQDMDGRVLARTTGRVLYPSLTIDGQVLARTSDTLGQTPDTITAPTDLN